MTNRWFIERLLMCFLILSTVSGCSTPRTSNSDVNINALAGRESPLAQEAIPGNVAQVSALLAQGAEVNAKDTNGDTPLHDAAYYSSKAVAEALIAHGANVNAENAKGETPLHNAALHGNQAVTEALLAHGADVNAKNAYGVTPLHYAGNKGNQAVVELLIAHGANVNALTNGGWTPLHYAVTKGDQAVVELLIAHGANVNARTNDGWTPLHYAASFGHQAVAEMLLAHGADANAKDTAGVTPLSLATSNGYEDIAALLLVTQAQHEQETGHPDQAFARYRQILQNYPASVHISTDPFYADLMKHLLDTARKLKSMPPLTEEYRQEMVVGIDAIKTAATDADFQKAESHFAKASRLAPWSPQPYDALGHVLESQKKYKEAAGYYKLYLLVQPNAPNARAVQDHIYVLEGRSR